MESTNNPLMVRVTSITYNQAPYIRQCLDGFVMQKTNFRFEVVIHDDASTDGTDVIIREYAQRYPDIIKPIFEKENQYSKGGFALVSKAFIPYCKEYAKYIAQCEGDDYWIDSLKLQKQVDYMETHPDVGLCYTDYSECDKESRIQKQSFFEQQKGFRPSCFKEHLLNKCYIAPMTWLYRKSILDEIGDYGSHSDGTFALSLEFFLRSKVAYIPDTTAVYRIAAGSAAHQTDPKKIFRYRKGVYDTQWIYAKKSGYSEIELGNLKASQYLSMIPFALDANDSEFIEEAKDYCGKIGFNLQEYIAICRNRKQLVESPSYRLGNMLLTPLRKIHLDRLFTKYRR